MKLITSISVLLLSLNAFSKAPSGFRFVPNDPNTAIIVSEKKEQIASLQEVHGLLENEATIVLVLRLMPQQDRPKLQEFITGLNRKMGLPTDFPTCNSVSSLATYHDLSLEEAFVVYVMRNPTTPDLQSFLAVELNDFIAQVSASMVSKKE